MGLCAGLLSIGYFTILYLIKPSLLLTPWALFSFLIIVVFKMMDAYSLWKAKQGIIVFKDTLRSVFMVSVISLLILTVFYHFMFNFVDLSLIKQLQEKIAANAMQAFNEKRITQVQLDEARSWIEGIRMSIGLSSVIYSVLLLVGFFYAVVFAGISRLIGRGIPLPPPSAS